MRTHKNPLSLKELSAYLNIHPLTLQRYARAGQVPGFKVKGAWKFDQAQIKRWVKGKKRLECPLILREN